MSNELVIASAASVPAIGKAASLPVLVERAGGAARFAWDVAYVAAAGIAGDAKDTPLFQASNGRAWKLSGKAMTSKRICKLVKRRLKDAGLPERLSPHSFRVNMANRVMWRSVMDVRKFPKFGA